MVHIAGSLEALLSGAIDYAGLYPPAALPLPIVAERFQGFLASPERWLMNRLVLPQSQLGAIQLQPGWRVSLLVDAEPGPLPPQVQTLETKLSHGLSLPTYCEAPLGEISGAFAKVRTGALSPDAIPDARHLASFLCRAAELRMPFKATAGLHHAIRAERPLTYALDSPRAVMHGFLNVLVAAAFAWYGVPIDSVTAILEETDAEAFEFADEELRCRGARLGTRQVHAARRDFAHSFGSCSFEEPVSDLRALELLP